jgi:predicted MFS family arabinose efflux permease
MNTDRGIDRTTTILLATLCGVSVANIYYAQPLLALIGSSFSMRRATLGLVVGAAQLGYLIGLVLLVPLSDLVDRRRLIVVQIVGAALCLLLVASSTDTVMLLIGMGLTGLFSVVVQVLVASAAILTDPHHRGRTIGTVTSGVVVGIILARTASGLIADAAGWRSVYTSSAALSLVLAAILARRLPPIPGVRGTYRRAVGSLFTMTTTNRVFRIRALMAFFLFASFGTLWSGMALPLSGDPWNLSVTQIGAFGIAGLVGAVGAKRAGLWADCGHDRSVTAVGLTLLVLSWVAIAQAPRSLIVLAAGVVLLDFAVQAVHVTSQHMIVQHSPDSAGSIIGSYMVFYSLGSALGAFGASSLFVEFGWTAVCLSGGLYGVLALTVWVASNLTDFTVRSCTASHTRSSPASRPSRAWIACRIHPCHGLFRRSKLREHQVRLPYGRC